MVSTGSRPDWFLWHGCFFFKKKENKKRLKFFFWFRVNMFISPTNETFWHSERKTCLRGPPHSWKSGRAGTVLLYGYQLKVFSAVCAGRRDGWTRFPSNAPVQQQQKGRLWCGPTFETKRTVLNKTTFADRKDKTLCISAVGLECCAGQAHNRKESEW